MTTRETPFCLPTSDGKRISGIMYNPPQSSQVAVVLVHGLTGHMTEYLHIMLARYLLRAGLPVFRFNLYGDEANERKFHDSTIRLHVSDTKCVVEHARSLGFSRVVLIGHSLGSPVAIEATDPEISGLVLLDPTGDPKDRIKDWQTYDPRHQLSFLDWRIRIILGEEWIADAKTFPDPFEQVSKVRCPVQIIAAERAEQMTYCVRYRESLANRPEIQVISGATHCFTEDGAVESVGQAIEDWIQHLIH